MKHWRSIVIGVSLLALVGVVLSIFRPAGFGIDDAHKIEPGMTQAKITDLLGQPPDVDFVISIDTCDEADLDMFTSLFGSRPDQVVEWGSNSATVQVWFVNNHAIDVSTSEQRGSIRSKIRRWVHLEF